MELEDVVANLVQKVEHRFYGKYRGLVVDNADSEHLGRLRLRVPGVLGDEVVTGWATPCAPYGGDANQGFLFVPEVGAGVWVEFEGGNLDLPIWVGMFWSKPGGESELPKPNGADGVEEGSVQDPPTRKIIKTKKGHTIQLEDKDGEEMVTIVEGTKGHMITMDADGIKVVNGANGNQIILGASGIQIGSDEAKEPFVLGDKFMTNVTDFLTALNGHTHTGNQGAPTSPPTASMQLEVPLSEKHKVE
jgi:uncharacterized protein involved in type VI secretion and phage assembly